MEDNTVFTQAMNLDRLSLLKIENLKQPYEQIEKLLSASLDSRKVVVSRATTLTLLCSTLAISLIGYSVTKGGSFDKLNCIAVTALMSGAYYLVICWYLWDVIKGKDSYELGSKTCYYVEDFFFQDGMDINKEQLIMEIESYNERFVKNEQTNKEDWGRYNYALKATVLSPIVILAMYWLL